MKYAFIVIGIVALLGAGMYGLYLNGYVAFQRKAALCFMGNICAGGNQCHAQFQSCSGFVQRVLRFRNQKMVSFSFDAEVSKGSVSVFVMDRNKQILLVLNSDCPTGSLPVNRKERYYLRITFEKADGACRLKWQETKE